MRRLGLCTAIAELFCTASDSWHRTRQTCRKKGREFVFCSQLQLPGAVPGGSEQRSPGSSCLHGMMLPVLEGWGEAAVFGKAALLTFPDSSSSLSWRIIRRKCFPYEQGPLVIGWYIPGSKTCNSPFPLWLQHFPAPLPPTPRVRFWLRRWKIPSSAAPPWHSGPSQMLTSCRRNWTHTANLKAIFVLLSCVSFLTCSKCGSE